MLTEMALLNGTTLALLVIAAFSLRALRQGEWWKVPHLVSGSAVALVLVAILVWVAGTLP